ncbi:MAG: bifunctional UDP-N-acetylglucosamine diphosphorylase/glucosamine-1-phosphate N-acetyltransferase GlmU [Bdellovibrio sp.]|jgi:bifunctional UDP-N-acetylglucosamine pyrophosphorylase/glucosamine-1-phosphate N-acetyltransferase
MMLPMKSDSHKEKTDKPKWTAIILAAGKGTRMGSPLPKVLHPVAGRPMLQNVIEACFQAGVADIRLVVGHGSHLVQNVVDPLGVHLFTQTEQKGTADAVMSAEPELVEGNIIILNGDHPLLTAADLGGFIEKFEQQKMDLAVVTAKLKDPKDFGRVVRSSGQLVAIVEAKDAAAETLKINEVNTGIYVAKASILGEFLPKIENNNSKKEYYLTDILSLTIHARKRVGTLEGNPRVAFGVNTQAELAKASRLKYRQKAKELMDKGVLILDPQAVYIEETVEVAPGSVIYPQVYIRGKSKIGTLCAIEPNCFIVDSILGEGVQLKANSYLERVQILNRASVGPFARLRPETIIGEEAQVGNFVEMKKVRFGAKSKAGHLTYLGDADVGSDVNIGCGTITCNYAVDKKKYKTVIGNGTFVGSDTQFVAPITIGENAVIGSGSTITKDVPARALAVARGKQVIIENYVPSMTTGSEKKSGE